MNTVDYGYLSRAQQLYELEGYRSIEVPWRVSAGILEITRPAGSLGDYLIEGSHKGLIASGEQGFMTLMNKGVLPAGRYQTITPCFRNEPYDDIHSKQFMKLELIEILNDKQDNLEEYPAHMIKAARIVFEKLSGICWDQFSITVQNPDDPLLVSKAYDIELNIKGRSIELGSYGVRRAHFGTWVYGTGLAEPRFSKTIQARK